MISVLLTILKIIGIVLLCILGLLFLMILAFLLVPLRYQAQGSYTDKKLNAEGGVSWLLHLVSVRAGYRAEGGAFFRVRILGFSLLDSRRQKKGEKPRTSKKPADKEPTEDTQAGQGQAAQEEIPKISPDILESLPRENAVPPETERTQEPKASGNQAPQTENTGAQPPRATVREKETQAQRKARKAAAKETKTAAREAKAAEKARRKADQKRRGAEKAARREAAAKKRAATREKLEDLLDMIQDKENQKSLRLLKTQLGKLLRHVLPRKLRLKARIGFSNPAATGQLLGLVYAFYPLYGDHIRVVGEFEEEVLEGEFFFKGRIRFGSLIIIAARVILDKNIRRMIKTAGGI